jgi:hypothetical protein
MAILEEEVLVTVGGNKTNYYETLGYKIPRYLDNQGRLKVKRGTKILVKVEDLPRVSTQKVTKICDECGKHIKNQEYGVIISRREERDGKDRCHQCGKINGGITRKSNVPYEKSLENFAKQNNMTHLLNEFSDKNIKKPESISYGTEDEYLWDCPVCKSEYPMEVRNRTNNKCNCPYCHGARVNDTNCLWTTHPEIAKLLKNPQRGYEITAGKNKKEDFICIDCGYEQRKTVNDVSNQGFTCRCGDGLKYPEKFTMAFLDQLNTEYETQKTFEWSSNKRYDFYIEKLYNLIIEVHGQQHYNGSFETAGGRSLEQEVENDKIKMQLALENNINYIIIDCRKSELEYMKKSFINSELSDIFNLNNIDWLGCHEFALNSLVKVVCDHWSTTKDTSEIGKIVNLSRTTVVRYLNKGASLGWCPTYDPKEEARKTREINLMRSQKERRIGIVQLNKYGEFIGEWESAAEVYRRLGINNIPTVLKGRQKTAGGFKWMYKEDYDKQKVTH